MDAGHFYFLSDAYFSDFPDPYLERNRETVNGILHGRPCYFSFLDQLTQVFWMIPFSSKVEKFRSIYESKVRRYGKCDTLVFGELLGYPKAFLIQNMCPAISKYIQNEYIDKITNIPVRVTMELEQELIQKSKLVLALARQGKHVIFPDVFKIETELIRQLSEFKDTKGTI